MTRHALDELLADLNPAQREAVTHRDGPLLVIAGPGSGKTRVITRRAAYLVRSGVPARNVLAITFTNKAADEMKRRIMELGVGAGMWMYTFHALGVRLLREYGALVGLAPNFTIYDEDDSLRAVKEAVALTRVGEDLRADDIRAAISRAKNELSGPDECRERAEWPEQIAIAQVYAAYEQVLAARNAVDFDDLLLRVALLLRDHPDVRERLNIRFRYLLIDEYQDTNHAQYLIARHLSEQHGNICATGDPDQSIYAWRGADIRNILEFERDFPSARIVRLEQNYRSAGHVLAVAARLIACNRKRKRKELWTERGDGAPVEVWQFSDSDAEAARVAAFIAEQHAAGRPYSDVAITYRVNAVSRGFEQALRDRGIPYRIARGLEFYNRREIKDTLAYLKLIVNPADDAALLRIINVPPRGIGATTVERLRVLGHERGRPLLELLRDADTRARLGPAAARRLTGFATLYEQVAALDTTAVSEAVSTVLRHTGLEEALRQERDAGGEDRLANVQELVTAALKYEQDAPEPSLLDFLQRVALTSDQDAVDERAGAVLLLTLHAAKGLEFPIVLLAGLEQGLLPHERALRGAGDLEEERRLCFVGCTRARDRLVLTTVADRMVRGQSLPRPASQFLREMDDGRTIWHDFRTLLPGLRARAHLGGFEPLVDDLPPDEAAALAPRRRLRAVSDDLESEPPVTRPRRPRLVRGDARTDDSDEHAEPGLSARPQRAAAAPRRPSAVPPASDAPAADSRFARWKPGTLVTHDRYGLGQVVWIQPGPPHTRASIRFTSYGEKVLILELAPVRELRRET